jgi:hypothetical protein
MKTETRKFNAKEWGPGNPLVADRFDEILSIVREIKAASLSKTTRSRRLPKIRVKRNDREARTRT